ncbi:hypothetical protein [uncultured Pseudomonas sp.]|uniref:hypothetical protein n=1 Tax=uncultured Pseudomonas sp. TaxID=114707 RepID=UPI0025836CD6|nr:hypothetical protein [uncultured Pseudomonas sp.]
MDTEVEAQVWRSACTHYAEDLDLLLQDGLGNFKRRPGFDDLTRLDRAALCPLGFELLGVALAHASRRIWHFHHQDFIELRWQLRLHLKRHLQAWLIRDGHASGLLRDDYFAGELGL